jgi:flagellar biosynthesis/type III secretory pathway protein FliH
MSSNYVPSQPARHLLDIYDAWERRLRAEAEAEGEAKGRAEGKEAGRAEGKEAGRAEGKEAGRAVGKEAGRAVGFAIGELQGIRETLVACYRARFGDFPAEFHAIVEATADVATLRRWVALCAAATADDITAAFSAASPR